MAIGTIFLILLAIYIPGYACMIGYDLFIKKDPADLIPKQEDEDVDISDEAGKFQPITIERERKENGASGNRADPKSGEQYEDKGKEEVKDGKPLPDGFPPDDNPQAMVVDEEDEPHNRKSLSDTGKNKDEAASIELTDEEKARLGKFKRIKQERLDKFNQEVKEKSKRSETGQEVKGEKEVTPKGQSEETKPSDEPKARQADAETSNSDKADKDIGGQSPARETRQRKRYESPKKVMQMPEGHKAPVFEPTVRIADDAGQTKLAGGQTVEQLEEEVKATLADDMAFAQKQLESLWILSKSELEPEVSEEDILRPPDNADGTARKASTFNLPT